MPDHTETVELLRQAMHRLRHLPHPVLLTPPVAVALSDLLQVLSWCPSAADPTDLTAARVCAVAVLDTYRTPREEQIMSEPILKDLLAYPTRVEDVTARSLLRYLLVQTRVLGARVANAAAGDAVPFGPDNRAELRRWAGEYGMAFAAAHLLRVLIADDPHNQGADDAARTLWECWGDGANMGELLWDWLTDEGIAPEQIQLAYEAAKVATDG